MCCNSQTVPSTRNVKEMGVNSKCHEDHLAPSTAWESKLTEKIEGLRLP